MAIHIAQSDNGRKIHMKLGDTLEIQLSGNPTTGYEWKHVSSGEPICDLQEQSQDAQAGKHGASGVYHWQCRAARIGQTRIVFAYARAWETQTPPAQTFTLDIEVDA